MAGEITDYWFNAIGVRQDYKTMVYYAGDGGDTFEINFEGGYINKSHVKAYKTNDGDRTRVDLTLTFITESRVKTNEAVPVGWTVLIYRDTPKALPLAAFVDGAVITALNLDRNAKQAVFSVAELVDRFDDVNANSEEALKQVYEAVTTSAEALVVATAANVTAGEAKALAVTADTNAAAAVVTANAAEVVADDAYTVATGIEAKADAAVVTANDASSVANGIDAKATAALAASNSAVTKADSAIASANAAVTTANAAKATAEGIDAKATTALSNSQTAVNTANQAKADVTAAVILKVDKAGDTMGGPLIMSRDGTLPKEPATKAQLDVQAQATTAVAGRVTVLEAIKPQLFMVDYKHGTAAAPPTLTTNYTNSWTNPWPGRSVAGRVEVLFSGVWGEPGMGSNAGTGTSSFGAKLFMRDTAHKLWTGNQWLVGASAVNGGAWDVSSGTYTSLPFRIVLWTID